MHIRSKVVVAVLALAVVSYPSFAQTPQQGPPPDQSQRPDGFGPRGPLRQMRPGEPRGQRGRMGMRGRGMGPQEFGLGWLLNDPNLSQQLGVTAAQAAKIRQQKSEFRKTEIRNRADLQIKRMDLNDLLSAEKPDRTAIDSKLQEISAARLALEKSAIDYRLNMRDALTPAQQQKLQQMMTQRSRSAASGNAAPSGPRGGGRVGGGAASPPNPQGQAPPNR